MLPGWGGRTRTRKRHFGKAVENAGQILVGLRNVLGQETSLRARRGPTCRLGFKFSEGVNEVSHNYSG
jgi:hypothetical protein